MGRKKTKQKASKASKDVKSNNSNVTKVSILFIFVAIGAAVWTNTFTSTSNTSKDDSLIVHFVSNGASSNEYLETSNSHVLKCSTPMLDVFDFNKYHYYMPNGKRISVASDVCTTSTTTTLHVTRVPKSQHYVWPAPQIGHFTNVSLRDGTNVRSHQPTPHTQTLKHKTQTHRYNWKSWLHHHEYSTSTTF